MVNFRSVIGKLHGRRYVPRVTGTGTAASDGVDWPLEPIMHAYTDCDMGLLYIEHEAAAASM